MDAVLFDLFHSEVDAPSAAAAAVSYRRTSPHGSLLSRVALHSLVFGNARAVSELWQR